jgi:hypothetical protein
VRWAAKRYPAYLALNDTVISKIRVRIAKFPEYRTALVSATGKIDVRARRAASAGFDNRSQIDEHYMACHRPSSSMEPQFRCSSDSLRHHPEGSVARKRAPGCYHLDFSAARAGGYRGGDFRARNNCEDGRSTVEADAGRASQIGPQNRDGRSHIAGGGLCFHERA